VPDGEGELKRRVGRALRTLRVARGYTQQKVADRARCHRTYLSAVEAGRRNLTAKALLALADALQASIAELFGEPGSSARRPPSQTVALQIGAAVRTLRLRRGISQEALGKRARLNRSYVAGIETGQRNPTLRNVEKLARALQVPVAALFGCSPDQAAEATHRLSGD